MDENIKKHLVFHFYCDDNYEQNRAIKMHLQCLKFYSHVFDDALFCIAVQDINNKKLICDIEKNIIDCGFKNLTLKVVKNSIYREALTFYEEVVLKMKDTDGMTFFGHTKGYTNYIKLPNGATESNIDTWILGLYYLSLSNIEEVETYLFGKYAYKMYGSFLSYCEKNSYGQGFPLYSGTFFWINNQGLLIKENNNFPKLTDLTYAENFLSMIFNKDDFYNIGTYYGKNNFMSYIVNYYQFANETISWFLTEAELKDFIEYKAKMINSI